MTAPALPVADVRTTDLLDALVLTARNPAQGREISRLLRAAAPDLAIRVVSDGVRVSGADVHRLPAAVDGLELRWSAEARQFTENRRNAWLCHPACIPKVAEIRTGGRPVAARLLAGVKGLDVLDDHQWVNVAAMTLPGAPGLSVFDEQGAGKTVTFIFAFDVLVGRDEADFALIIAPKSMVAEWPRDFARFKGDLYKVATIAGGPKEKKAALRSGPDVVVTNFETAVALEDELSSLIRRHGRRAILAVDESFYIKNLDARRTRTLRRLREWCGRAFVLCGTPAPNSPHDLVQQFSIVDFGYTFAGVTVPEDREAARPVVQSCIESRGLFVRHLKSQVLPGLPAKRFNVVLLPLEPQQRRLYAGALNDLIVDLRAADDRTFRRQLASFLARRSALLQICSNPGAVSPDYSEVPAKLLSLDSLLEELVTVRKEKVVLWSFYTAAIDAIMRRYTRFGPVRYDGAVDDIKERREAVRRFQEDDTTMLFVGNPAAAGAGLTLHRARFAIYESMSNQAAHYLQSLDRIHRRGQTRGVEYLVLLCENTIELEEYDRLTGKERAAQQLLGDNAAPPVTRQSMLAGALASESMLRAGA